MNYLLDCNEDPGWDFDYMTLYERSAEAVLTAENCPYEVTVSLIITDDEEIKTINFESRNINSATDVLSFPMIEYASPSDFSAAENDPSDFDPETGELMIGDIVLSADRVKSQAEQYGHDIQREFAFLIVHSMLHLCGYDHIKEEDRLIMEERQREIMESLYDDFPALAVE
ncbi:MAG: rRNA maturation RNase YbeY [Lachnospiraceae bacterium]|nr:rRNA maturation RNase YbeY [Lachnospiraceae bacterium]